MIRIENVSKTVIMIGGIIISILVITIFIFVFNNLTLAQKEKVNTEKIMQAVEFNKQFESFNRENLYGTDIISICNLMQNYNVKDDDEKINIQLKINIGIENANYYKKGTYKLEDILKYTKELKKENNEELYKFKTKKFKCIKVEYKNDKIYEMQFIDV